MMRPLLAITAVLALFAAGAADAARTVRCDGTIIDVGDSLAYVLARCGEPAFHSRRDVPARSRSRSGGTFVSGVGVTEILIYERGFGKFPAELEFVHGRLRHIELLTR